MITLEELKKVRDSLRELSVDVEKFSDGSHTEKHDQNLYCRNQNGELHRDGDKPAIIGADGYLGWCLNGERHRSRGPAVIHPNGKLEWWINGQYITPEVNEWLAGEEWQGTPEQIAEFQLRFT